MSTDSNKSLKQKLIITKIIITTTVITAVIPTNKGKFYTINKWTVAHKKLQRVSTWGRQSPTFRWSKYKLIRDNIMTSWIILLVKPFADKTTLTQRGMDSTRPLKSCMLWGGASSASSISRRCSTGLRSEEIWVLNMFLCSPNHPWTVFALLREHYPAERDNSHQGAPFS